MCPHSPPWENLAVLHSTWLLHQIYMYAPNCTWSIMTHLNKSMTYIFWYWFCDMHLFPLRHAALHSLYILVKIVSIFNMYNIV
jgi:hypothetical protein